VFDFRFLTYFFQPLRNPQRTQTLYECGEGQRTQRAWNGCICDCEADGNRQSECLSGARLGPTVNGATLAKLGFATLPLLGFRPTSIFFNFWDTEDGDKSHRCEYAPGNKPEDKASVFAARDKSDGRWHSQEDQQNKDCRNWTENGLQDSPRLLGIRDCRKGSTIRYSL
jgi:hypothetical protein